MANYGFIVLPEEKELKYGETSQLEEGENGTIFVDVETSWIPPLIKSQGKIVAELYYHSNSAKWNATTEKELKKRFPKSFAQKDSGDQYTKLRKELDAKIWA